MRPTLPADFTCGKGFDEYGVLDRHDRDLCPKKTLDQLFDHDDPQDVYVEVQISMDDVRKLHAILHRNEIGNIERDTNSEGASAKPQDTPSPIPQRNGYRQAIRKVAEKAYPIGLPNPVRWPAVKEKLLPLMKQEDLVLKAVNPDVKTFKRALENWKPKSKLAKG